MIIKIIFFPITLVCYLLIYFYKFIISPMLPKTCIYYPTCSSYMLQAIKQHGVCYGFILGCKRILRCTSKHKGGIDYVPLSIKGDYKWIF